MKVGVIGAGVMGRGIVQTSMGSQFVEKVVWYGRNQVGIDRGVSALHSTFSLLVDKGKLNQYDVDLSFAKVEYTVDLADLSDCDLVIEAVSEDFDIKKNLFREIDQKVGSKTILATNTSSLSITALAAETNRPDKVIGIHFFNPAPVMKLVEVVEGLAVSGQTLQVVLSFVRSLNKEPVIVKEAPGFIVNRMLIPMINEAIGIMAENVASAEEIDKAMCLGANHPIGPLALADLIGNDVNLSIMDVLYRETGDSKYRAHPLLRKMVRANHLGRKTKKGFFVYK